MDYSQDKRVVMTLDAGGTNFVFSAIQSNREVLSPIRLPSGADHLDICLKTLVEGFQLVRERLTETPVAISFAFPGPADYQNGVIGDLPNLPAFRGGVALKTFLQQQFHLPVYINNDGNLYAYGEALAGTLPVLNHQLREAGNEKQYRNLVGITLGTGFGAGVVIDGTLLTGDNGCGGDVWVFSDKFHPEMIAEETVSIHAVKNIYRELSGDNNKELTPKDICDIADEKTEGDVVAARKTFERFGQGLGFELNFVLTLIDGIIVLGGGLTGACRHFFPAMLHEMRGTRSRIGQSDVPRQQMEVFDLTNPGEKAEFLKSEIATCTAPGSHTVVPYLKRKKTGITVSTIETSLAVNLGAYNYALAQIDHAGA